MFISDQQIPVQMGKSLEYYRSVGYSIEETKYGNILMVDVDRLPVNSNKEVECSCEECKTIFKRSYQMLNRAKVHLCKECSYSERVKIINYSAISKSNSLRVGNKHPRFNPNKNELKTYKARVHAITRSQDISILENSDKPRGLCGVEGAYQLDHIISITHGFKNGISPEVIGNIKNLQFLPWKENRTKWHHVPSSV